MPLPVSLKAVVDEIEMLGGEGGMHAFLNRQTGEIFGGTEEQISKAQDPEADDLVDWEVEIIDRLREVLESPDWLELPRRDTHEDYQTMERFCFERCEGKLQEELLSAITGRGAFGRFKDAIHRRGISDEWYSFCSERSAKDAREWLAMNGIAFKP